MIKQEQISETLIKTYSDSGFKIKNVKTGATYDEAIDPIIKNRIYEETDIPIETESDE